MINLKSLSEESVLDFVKQEGLPPFRAGQLLHWIYHKNVSDIKKITELSRTLRDSLSKIAYISTPKLISSECSSDGTTKYLLVLEDGERTECVLIPDGNRYTLCVSSQVGCSLGCKFCLTGKIAFKRNLRAHEITDQLLLVNNTLKRKRLTNIVFMGMGEPLMNIDEVMNSIRIINDYMGISKRRITVSTSGIVPNIIKLYKRNPIVNLAISLNAPDDRTRSFLMPVNRKYNLKSLIQTCRTIPLPPRSRITFEYVLIRGINDTVKHAEKTANILKGIPSKVNLIPYNPVRGTDLKRPDDNRVLQFQRILINRGITAIIRKSKGADISAACGQLCGKYELYKKAERKK